MRVGGTSSPHPSLETQLTVIIAGGNFNRSGSYRHKAPPPLSFPALGMDSLPPSLPIVHTRTKTFPFFQEGPGQPVAVCQSQWSELQGWREGGGHSARGLRSQWAEQKGIKVQVDEAIPSA